MGNFNNCNNKNSINYSIDYPIVTNADALIIH